MTTVEDAVIKAKVVFRIGVGLLFYVFVLIVSHNLPKLSSGRATQDSGPRSCGVFVLGSQELSLNFPLPLNDLDTFRYGASAGLTYGF